MEETDLKVSGTFIDFSKNAINTYQKEWGEKVGKYKHLLKSYFEFNSQFTSPYNCQGYIRHTSAYPAD